LRRLFGIAARAVRVRIDEAIVVRRGLLQCGNNLPGDW
jgi:hypothetical protein